MASAETGHGARHAPQPVQAARSTSGLATVPAASLKRMAPVGQHSPQVWHTTCFSARQDGSIRTFNAHGGRFAMYVSAPLLQVFAQSPQNVHSPAAKFTWGKPPLPFTRIFSGQALMQSPPRLHVSTKSGSSRAHGGRTTLRVAPKSPRRNWAREISFVTGRNSLLSS